MGLLWWNAPCFPMTDDPLIDAVRARIGKPEVLLILITVIVFTVKGR